jgi:hypothetical protein
MTDAMEEASALLGAAAAGDEEFADAVAGVDGRVVGVVREFYDGLERHGATAKVSTRRKTVELNRQRVASGQNRIRQTEVTVTEDAISAVLAGMSDGGGMRFYRVREGAEESLTGRASERMPQADVDQIGEFFRRACVVELTETAVRTAGKIKRSCAVHRLRRSYLTGFYSKLDKWSESGGGAGVDENLPSRDAVSTARTVIGKYWMCDVRVSAVEADADGGVGVYAGRFPERYVVMLCDNEGGIGALASARTDPAPAWTWDAPETELDRAIVALALRTRAWLEG